MEPEQLLVAMQSTVRDLLKTDYAIVERKIRDAGIKKVYVLDTNVLVTNPFAWYILSGNDVPTEEAPSNWMSHFLQGFRTTYSREPNAVVLVSPAEDELDMLKGDYKKTELKRWSAGHSISGLERLVRETCESAEGSRLEEGITLPNKAVVFKEWFREEYDNGVIARRRIDHEIVLTAYEIKQRLAGSADVIFVSNDAGARLFAESLKIKAEDFRYERVDNVGDLYTGIQRIVLPSTILEQFNETGRLTVTDVPALRGIARSLHPHQVLFFNDDSEPVTGFVNADKSCCFGYRFFSDELLSRPPFDEQLGLSRKARKKGAEVPSLEFNKRLKLGPRKRALMELLLNGDIACVTISGTAGTGKTLCALLAGLIQVREGKYKNITYTRPIVALGDDIGFVPGTKRKKMEEWTRPAEDNLRWALKNPGVSHERITESIERMIDAGHFQPEPPTYMAGRTMDAFWIIDEAQNMTREELKMLLTRAGENTKVVVIGDPEQVISTRGTHVTKASNGLVHVMARFPGDPRYAHVTLPDEDVERSYLAKLAGQRL